uniref:ATP-binding protein n=1 Tax=Aeromonas caviae TaxID=648 RepID=UPI002B46F412
DQGVHVGRNGCSTSPEYALILDDWGLEAVNAEQRNALLEIMDDRYGKFSTVVVSQLPTEEWYASLGGNTLADAILDRLMHNAHRL